MANKLDHQLDFANQTLLFDAISNVSDSTLLDPSNQLSSNDSPELLNDLQNRIEYLIKYNAYLKNQADMFDSNIRQLRISISKVLKRQSDTIQSKIKNDLEKRDELMSTISSLEFNYATSETQIQSLSQQLESAISLNEELRLANSQLKSELDSLNLASQEQLTIQETNYIDNEISICKNALAIIESAENNAE